MFLLHLTLDFPVNAYLLTTKMHCQFMEHRQQLAEEATASSIPHETCFPLPLLSLPLAALPLGGPHPLGRPHTLREPLLTDSRRRLPVGPSTHLPQGELAANHQLDCLLHLSQVAHLRELTEMLTLSDSNRYMLEIQTLKQELRLIRNQTLKVMQKMINLP
jgi:hypothetical protein